MKEYKDFNIPFEGFHEGLPQGFLYLAEIIDCQVLELCRVDGSGSCLIPYMMNDALEYYLELTDATVTGIWNPQKMIVSVYLSHEMTNEDASQAVRYILILRQEDGNVCTLYFRQILEHATCYQYHRIGHFWVKGQEHWRRLVYIIGTIYDKYEYFETRFCNPEEMEIMHLIHFAPFRAWSPVSESLEEKYPDSEEGILVMEQLAEEAGDTGYVRLLQWYRRFHLPWLSRILSVRLLSPKRDKLYALLCRKVDAASLQYPQRDYGIVKNREIEEKRCETEQNLKINGFQGTYPNFTKDGKSYLATEEHPFTVMENEDFSFRIQLMEYPGSS